MTPARRDRESQKANDERERGKKLNEDKFTGFNIGCNEGTGDPAACNSLGEWYLLMRSDVISASRAFSTACFEKSHPQSCLNVARLFTSSSGSSAVNAIQDNLPNNIRYQIEGKNNNEKTSILSSIAFSIGCEAGNADACSDGAKIHLRSAAAVSSAASTSSSSTSSSTMRKVESINNEGGKKEQEVGEGGGIFSSSATSISHLQNAEQMLHKGCKNSTSEGVSSAKCCAGLGALYLSSAKDKMRLSLASITTSSSSSPLSSEVMKDMLKKEAMELLQKGCEGEQAKACMQLAAIHRIESNNFLKEKEKMDNTSSSIHLVQQQQRHLKKAEEYEKKGLIWSGMTEGQADVHIQRSREKRGGLIG
jgi:TPR repeat protein